MPKLVAKKRLVKASLKKELAHNENLQRSLEKIVKSISRKAYKDRVDEGVIEWVIPRPTQSHLEIKSERFVSLINLAKRHKYLFEFYVSNKAETVIQFVADF